MKKFIQKQSLKLSALVALGVMTGADLAVLGVLKIKDHVENPGQTPLQHGVIRLAVGGALFAVPIITESMTELIDQGAKGNSATAAKVDKVIFHTN